MADNLSDPLNGYNEKVVLAQAREMAHGGYLAAGFRYINLDGYWNMPTRDASGHLVADPSRFPSGIKALADKVHALGLRLGIYTAMCGNAVPPIVDPKTGVVMQQDIDDFLRWGVDEVKVDAAGGCITPHLNESYIKLGKALLAATNGSRPILYSCSWPAYTDPHWPSQYREMAGHCNMWRKYEHMNTLSRLCL